MIIAIYSSKGGVGKSTTAATLAFLWKARHPLLLDMDEQEATLAFADSLVGIERRQIEPSDFAALLPSLNPNRLVIIDCPPSRVVAGEALRAADLVLIPCVTEFMPVRAALSTLGNLFSGNAKIVLTRHNRADAEARELRKETEAEFGSKLCQNRIPNSRAVRAAVLVGQCVADFAPGDHASLAYKNLSLELEHFLGI